jgi:hypothetical protein
MRYPRRLLARRIVPTLVAILGGAAPIYAQCGRAGVAVSGVSTDKGMPFTADRVHTKISKTGGDSEKSQRLFSQEVARDTEGRTRIATPAHKIGITDITGPSSITVCDPVAGAQIALYPETHRAMVVKNMLSRRAPPARPVITVDFYWHLRDRSAEDIGTRELAGLPIRGVRITPGTAEASSEVGAASTPADSQEIWISQDMDLEVRSKSFYQRSGIVVQISLDNLRREEPNASLFQVPPDYKIENTGSGQQTAP